MGRGCPWRSNLRYPRGIDAYLTGVYASCDPGAPNPGGGVVALLLLTERTQQVLKRAEAAAVRAGADTVDPAHLFAALLGQEGSMALRILEQLHIDPHRLVPQDTRAAAATGDGGSGTGTIGRVPFAPDAKGLVERAAAEASALGHAYVGTEHLLLALASSRQPVADALRQHGASPERIRQALRELLG